MADNPHSTAGKRGNIKKGTLGQYRYMVPLSPIVLATGDILRYFYVIVIQEISISVACKVLRIVVIMIYVFKNNHT